MITEPLISIVMPAYNAEKTIKDAIQSVINQTYKHWELLVIDDCSKDSTKEIVQQLCKKDTRIILLKNEKNLGVSKSRNYGIRKSRGSWIALLDSDDMWVAEKLEKQYRLLNQREDADLIFTGSSFINSDGDNFTYILHVPKQIIYKQLLKQNLISCSSVLVRRGLLELYPMQRDDMHEDFIVWLQILKKGGKAYGLDEPLLIYRLSVKSKSGNKKKAAQMTYQVYRLMGLNTAQSIYYFFWYAVKNYEKYKRIYSKR